MSGENKNSSGDSGAAPLLNSVSSTCKRLSIGTTKFYALVKSRKLATVRLGARTMVAESELQRFVRDLQAQQS